MRRFSTVLVLVAILWTTSARAAENSPKSAESVVVWKRVETSTDPATISNEVAHALPARAKTKVAGAVTSFVAKLYKLDPKVFPQQVKAIADKVASLNGIAPGGSLVANQGVTVPFVAGVLPGRASHIPFLSDDQRTVGQVQKSVGPKLDQFIQYLGKATSGFSIAIRKMSIGQAMRELAADPSLQILSAPLRLKEAAGGGWVPWSLTTDDIATIHKVAALPTQQHPVVIVADSVSPDRSSELEARSFVLNEIAKMRSKIGLPPIRLYDAQCGLGVADPQWKAPPLDGGHPVHSVEIKASLNPLVAAVANGTSPQVIYLPLLRGSRCETETIRQIVEFHQLVSSLKGDIAKSSQPGIVDRYRKKTTDTVGAVGTSVKDGFMGTNVGVVDAVLFFGSTYADDHGNPVFTSMSWTFDPSSFKPQPPENSGGLYVVSAGNEGRSPTVEADGFQFPARSIKGSDTLAVMNADADGKLLCKSSVVTHSAHAFMTSFNGAIPGDCGTSFAAPRVAWLLALREAVRPAQAIPSRLAASLRTDALIAGTVRSEGGGSVLDLTTLFRHQLSSAAMPPAQPPGPLPLIPPLPVPTDPISPQQH